MYCEECMKKGIYKYGQLHHVVPRKRAPYMMHVPMNLVPLCIEHHTASPTGIHHNKDLMLEYLQEFQLKLKLMFTKDYYTFKELKELLEASDGTIKAITKTLMRYKEGYKTDQLIFHMLGNRDYLNTGDEENGE